MDTPNAWNWKVSTSHDYASNDVNYRCFCRMKSFNKTYCKWYKTCIDNLRLEEYLSLHMIFQACKPPWIAHSINLANSTCFHKQKAKEQKWVRAAEIYLLKKKIRSSTATWPFSTWTFCSPMWEITKPQNRTPLVVNLLQSNNLTLSTIVQSAKKALHLSLFVVNR